jgi:hypothetical protein
VLLVQECQFTAVTYDRGKVRVNFVMYPGPNVKILFCPLFMNFRNKLECFVLGKLFQPILTNILAENENL